MVFAHMFGTSRAAARSALFFGHRYRWELLCTCLAVAYLTATAEGSASTKPVNTAVVTVTDLPAGHTITDADVVKITVPPGNLSNELSPTDAIGAVTPHAISAHTVLTEAQLTASYPSVGSGQVVVAVPVHPGQELPQLRPGDTVELVFGADTSAITPHAANASPVSYQATVIQPPDSKNSSTGGLLSGGTDTTTQLVLATDKSSARNIATFAARALPGVVLIP